MLNVAIASEVHRLNHQKSEFAGVHGLLQVSDPVLHHAWHGKRQAPSPSAFMSASVSKSQYINGSRASTIRKSRAFQ